MPYDEENQHFEMYDDDTCSWPHSYAGEVTDPLDDPFFDDIDGMFDHIEDEEPDLEDYLI